MSRVSSTNRVTADFRIRYREEGAAEAVLRAISPDNFQAPEGIELRSMVEGGELRIEVTCVRGLGSLIATVDDLLSCIQAAERALKEVI